MIIAIDETGDFNPDSKLKSFFVATLLEQHQNGLEIKRSQFQKWLATIPSIKLKGKNEVKGSDLNDEELLSFVENVYNSDPNVRQVVVYFLPSENPESLMKVFKELEVTKLFELSELAKKAGKQEMAKQYANMAIWHKNAKKMHYPHFFKLVLLRNLIHKAFNTAVGVSILLEEISRDKESVNLLNIEIKIDQDFVRGTDPTIYWKEFLKVSFLANTKKDPVPIVDTWKNGHPFLTKYQDVSPGFLNFTQLFTQKCNFLNSHEHFELQIADITGLIINRFHNRNKAIEAYKALYKVITHQEFMKIILNEIPNLENPSAIAEISI
jgi:hypothetical protein